MGTFKLCPPLPQMLLPLDSHSGCRHSPSFYRQKRHPGRSYFHTNILPLNKSALPQVPIRFGASLTRMHGPSAKTLLAKILHRSLLLPALDEGPMPALKIRQFFLPSYDSHPSSFPQWHNKSIPNSRPQ